MNCGAPLPTRLGLEPARVLVGNGATELIHLTARAVLRSGSAAAIFTPTFGEFEAACRLQGVAPVSIAPAERRTFRWDLPAAARLIAALRPSLLFLCNPNNPTGTYLGADDLEAIVAALGDAGLLVLDEAYAPFVERRWDATRLLRRGNVVLLRSMTKDHALTGLRLGYLLSSRAVVERVGQVPAQLERERRGAGRRGWRHWQTVPTSHADARAVRCSRSYLTQELGRLGLSCSEASANFLLAGVGRRRGVATAAVCGNTGCAYATVPRSGCPTTYASACGAWRTAGAWPGALRAGAGERRWVRVVPGAPRGDRLECRRPRAGSVAGAAQRPRGRAQARALATRLRPLCFSAALRQRPAPGHRDRGADPARQGRPDAGHPPRTAREELRGNGRE